MVSTIMRLLSSGKMIGRIPHLSSSMNPMEGVGDSIILFSSSAIRSLDMMLMRSLLRSSASNVSSSMTKLCGKSDASHHAQGVVAEGDVRVERCGYYSVFEVVYAIEWVYEFSVAFLVQAECHGVYGKVSSVLVFFQSAVFRDWFSGVVAIALFACSDKFNLYVFVLELSCAEIAEDGELGFSFYLMFQCFCYSHSWSLDGFLNVYNDNINIF